MRIPLGFQSWPTGNKPLTVERLVNCYAEEAPASGKSRIHVRLVPGKSTFCDLGTADGVRGCVLYDGTVYCVAGDTLYSVSSGGSATSLGTVTAGTDPVTFSGYVNDLVIPRLTELFVSTSDAAYLWDGTTLTQVTDSDLTGAAWLTVLDNFIIYGADGVPQIQWSDLLDGASIGALTFATAEASEGAVLRGVVDHRELHLFCTNRIEVFYNTGNQDNQFLRAGNGLIERGCAARWSPARDDNTIFFLGDDKIVYRLQGRTPVRVSTHGFEDAVEGYATISDAEGEFHTFGGHKFYTLTFPTEDVTWCMDLNTGLWHERSTWNIGRDRARGYVRAFGKTLVGDYDTGLIYQLDESVKTDGGDTLEYLMQTPPISKDSDPFVVRRFEAEFEAGVGNASAPGDDPQVSLEWSDDGGRTWSNKHYRNLGAQGEYSYRTYWTRLGQSRRGKGRSFRLICTEPVSRKLIGLYVEAA